HAVDGGFLQEVGGVSSADFLTHFDQNPFHLFQIRFIGDGHRYQGAHLHPVVVGHVVDFAVGQIMKALVPLADLGDANSDFLHGPRDLSAYLNVVAYFHLIFKDDEEAGNQIANQVLGAEPDGQSQDSRAGQDGRRVDSDVEQQGEGGDEVDGVPGEGFDQFAQCQGLFPVDPLELKDPVDQFAREPQ